MTRWGMVIDLKRCIGCDACTVVCKAENGTPKGVFFTRTLSREVGEYPDVKSLYIPTLCNHCRNAPCEQACPTKATYRRPDGIVLVDDTKCIGCRACYVARPYKNRFHLKKDLLEKGYFAEGLTPFEKLKYADFVPGTVGKCTFCVRRIDRGQEPACVVTYPTDARVFGDLSDPSSNIRRRIRQRIASQLLAELGTEPSVYYVE
ncbi:MAG: 4Fe-4S dicluster domain-containing protein [Chloroflexi bacterium]|nr:4Fe-4S dicluster domain-containing protein [Chloroflexota bacterium]